MKLHPPFKISARLLPALDIRGAWLSLVSIEEGPEFRQIATFALDIPGQPEYLDSELRSGIQGFKSQVAAFEAFLGFLTSSAESSDPEMQALFPGYVRQWARDYEMELTVAIMELTDVTGLLKHHLIEE